MNTPELHHLNHLDYAVLVLYMLMIVGIGIFVARFNRKTSDYFKGGGRVPWKLAGLSLFISGFSAFMFVGASGIAYGNGGGAVLLFSFALPAYLLGYWIFGPLWKRTRIDTPLQFLTRRYSQGTTYFYMLMAVVPNTLVLGIMIYTLCIFTSTALGIGAQTFDFGPFTFSGFQATLLITGGVMILYTTLGGLWGVMVTDALQFFIVLLVTLIMVPMSYVLLGDGNLLDGVTRLVRDAPEGYFSVGLEGRPFLFWPTWAIYIIFGYNVNWHIAQRYYSVADERDTRKMALWAGVFSFVLPMLWILPVFAAPILFPDIDQLWPELVQPSEASFVTMALAVLPHGMLGVLVAAIFAATMSSTDTMFNWLSAVLTKDVYVPLSRNIAGREPTERSQLWVGRSMVALLGAFAIWTAFNVERFGGAFDVYMRAESLYKITLFVPVFFGLLILRTPWWSAIASVSAGVAGVLGIGVAAAIQSDLPIGFMNVLFAEISATWLGLEWSRYELNAIVGLLIAAAVFLGSGYWNRREGAFGERISALEKDLATPAHTDSDERVGVEGLIVYVLMGRLAVAIGLLLLIVSIPTLGRAGWLNAIAGAFAVLAGAAVLAAVRSYARRRRTASTPDQSDP